MKRKIITAILLFVLAILTSLSLVACRTLKNSDGSDAKEQQKQEQEQKEPSKDEPNGGAGDDGQGDAGSSDEQKPIFYSLLEESVVFTPSGSKKIDGLNGFEEAKVVNDTYLLLENEDKKDDVITTDTMGRRTSLKRQTDYYYKLYNVTTGEFQGEIPNGELIQTDTYFYEGENTTPSSSTSKTNRTSVTVGGGKNCVLLMLEEVEGTYEEALWKWTYYVYDNDLNLITTFETTEQSSNHIKAVDFDSDDVAEALIVDDVLYKFNGETFIEVEVDLASIPFNLQNTSSFVYGNKYIHKRISSTKTIETYSLENFSLVYSYDTSKYNAFKEMFLDNGNYIVQGTIIENDNAKTYDFIFNNIKYSIETKHISVETEQIKDVEFDYIFQEGFCKSVLAKSDIQLENCDALVMTAGKIDRENKVLTERELLVFGFSGKDKFVKVDSMIENQDLLEFPIKTSNDNYVVRDKDGLAHLYNAEENALIKTIEAGSFINDNYYIVGGNNVGDNAYQGAKIYDIDFNLIFEEDSQANTTETAYILPDAVIVKTLETKNDGEIITTWKRVGGEIIAISSNNDNPNSEAGTYKYVEVKGNCCIVTTVVSSEIQDEAMEKTQSVVFYSGSGNELAKATNIENWKAMQVGEAVIIAVEYWSTIESKLQFSFYHVGK